MIDYDSAYYDGEYFWFIGRGDNVIYLISNEYRIEAVAKIPSGVNLRDTPNCIRHTNSIICLPDKGKKIVIFNLITKKMDYIDVQISRARTSILNAFMYKDRLWCVSYSSGEILKCNVYSCEVEQRFKILACSANNYNAKVELVENNLYLVNKINNSFSVFNLDTEEYRTISVDCDENGFSTIAVVDNVVYLTGRKNNIYCWNSTSFSIISLQGKLKYLRENEDAICPRFNQSIVCEKSIIFTPLNSSDFLCDEFMIFNTENREIVTYKLSDGMHHQVDNNIIACAYGSKKIFVHDELVDAIAIVDLDKKDIQHKKIIKEINRKTLFWMPSDVILQENFALDLETFIIH